MSTGVFSVRYSKPDDVDSYAVDWGWGPKNGWTCSEMESGTGHRWVRGGPLVDEPVVCHIGIGDSEGVVAIRIDDQGAAEATRGTVNTITLPGVRTEAYQALLKHFGLAEWADEFPPEKIETMSPASLAAARRKKEAEYNLPKLEIRNDILGSNDFAEDYS